METDRIILRPWRESDAEIRGFVPTGETCIDANQYQGENRPIRVLRLEINK